MPRSPYKRRVTNSPRRRSFTSPLDRAASWEVEWQQVAPLFEAARAFPNPCFVYFIGEEDDGSVKIGVAKDPILRLRGLQTGNPRALRVEFVLLGNVRLERLFHVFWGPFVIWSKRGEKMDVTADTEWFIPKIRYDLDSILKLSIKAQLELLSKEGATLLDLGRVVRDVLSNNGLVIPGGKPQVADLFAAPMP